MTLCHRDGFKASIAQEVRARVVAEYAVDVAPPMHHFHPRLHRHVLAVQRTTNRRELRRRCLHRGTYTPTDAETQEVQGFPDFRNLNQYPII